MKVNYNPDNVKAIANTVADIMEKNIKDIQKETIYSKVLFNDDLEMRIRNNFGIITKIDLTFSKQYVHSYSATFERRPFQIQGYIRKKTTDDYLYSTYSLVPFAKRLYLNNSSIAKFELLEDQILNSLHFRIKNGKRYNFNMHPINKNLINSEATEECLLKVEELANYLYMLKKKYRFHDCTFEEIIRSLSLQYKLDIEIEENFKRIFNENKDKILTLSSKDKLK